MQLIGTAKKVTIYIGESDKWQHKPLYMAILEMLKKADCAGATVTRALAGFGANSRIHTANLVALSTDLPLVIAWIDNPDQIERIMPQLKTMVSEGLITVEDVNVVFYSHRQLRQLSAALPVQDLMSREVYTVHPETPLAEAAQLLLDKIYRALPVVDQMDRVVGILTEGDLLKRAKLLLTNLQHSPTPAEFDQEIQRLRQSGQRVGEFMTPDPITVANDTPVSTVIQYMVDQKLKRLPVVDADRRLSGIISRIDILRAMAHSVAGETPRQIPPAGQNLTVFQIMSTAVPAVQANASLLDVVNHLISRTQRRVIVIDPDSQVLGIITDGDLLGRATATERAGLLHSLTRRLPLGQEERVHLLNRTAADIMTTPVTTVAASTSLLDALQILTNQHIRRLPVVDAEGRLVGLVGRAGLLQALAALPPQDASQT